MKKNLKKVFGVALTASMVLALTACFQPSIDGPADSEEWIEDVSEWGEEVEDSEIASEPEYEEEEENMGMPNPWQDAASAEEAAGGAGLDSFSLVDGVTISGIDTEYRSYRYMDGVAEIDIAVGAMDVEVRKGLSGVAENNDISGDYTNYDLNWTQNIKGLVVNCYGFEENCASKITWTVDDVCYSITCIPEGGADYCGIDADSINSIINGLQ